jgi:hypothetical protein
VRELNLYGDKIQNDVQQQHIRIDEDGINNNFEEIFIGEKC